MRAFSLKTESTCFVDTNIWLYSFIDSQDEEKSEIAKQIILERDIVISTQIINEMSVNLLKKAKFTEERIQDLINSLYDRFSVFELLPDVLLKASKIRTDFSFSFWDSLVVASALDSEAGYLISEDMQNGFVLEGKLTIVNPFI